MKIKDPDYMPMPDRYSRRELNSLYREIPLKDATSRVLRKYFNAMSNLYGVITLQKAYEIISSQSPRLVTEDEFLAFAEIARNECEGYLIAGADELYSDGKISSPFEREIIDLMLVFEDMDSYVFVKENQDGKSLYIPCKKQLLLYSDPYYYEETVETIALKCFFSSYFKLSQAEVEEIFDDIECCARYSDNVALDTLNILDIYELSFEKKSDAKKFLDIFHRFYNATRLQCNCGYSPQELGQMHYSGNRISPEITLGPNIRKWIADGTLDADEFRQAVMAMDCPSESLRLSLLNEIAAAKEAPAGRIKTEKIGRNDPCPCGSGKKYKKCCGK